MEQIQMAVFLGNPGAEYRKTRHNFAWLFAEYLGERQGLSWADKFGGKVTRGSLGRLGDIVFLQPQTFMNLSGESVRKAMDFYRFDPGSILVIHDELELEFGKVHLRMGGGAKGHNGLRSIDQHLGTKEYLRLRMGIGRPAHDNIAAYVLSRFGPSEEAEFETIFGQCIDLVE